MGTKTMMGKQDHTHEANTQKLSKTGSSYLRRLSATISIYLFACLLVLYRDLDHVALGGLELSRYTRLVFDHTESLPASCTVRLESTLLVHNHLSLLKVLFFKSSSFLSKKKFYKIPWTSEVFLLTQWK